MMSLGSRVSRIAFEAYLTYENLCGELRASESLEGLQDEKQRDESDFE